MTPGQTLEIKVRFLLRDEIALGPGKADLMDAIDRLGSISGAARQLGMSYRRAWLLVDTMNRCFRNPLVMTAAGGRHGGGASLTPQGHKVLRTYRALQTALEKAAASRARELFGLLQG